MCTELLLAVLYFITIFTVNYFLYKLVNTYLTNIFYLTRLKTIFKNFNKQEIKNISILYFYAKNNFQNISLFNILKQFSNTKDSLVIGKTYSYLAKNIASKKNRNFSLIYYFKLLEEQYINKDKT